MILAKFKNKKHKWNHVPMAIRLETFLPFTISDKYTE